MGTSDITVDVYYFDKPIQISVTVDWGSMTYGYSTGKWNPDTHKYSEEPINPIAVNSNKITVSNNSDIGITAQFEYVPDLAYSQINGYFTQQDRVDGTQINKYNLNKVDSQSTWLWLKGTLPQGSEGTTITSGICTVTLRGGWAL